MDKSWMMIKHRWSSNEYKQGVESFLKFAKANLGSQTGVRCPCIDCMNSKILSIEVVRIHLIRRGIDCSYKTWVHHGELVPAHQPQTQDDDHHEHNEDVGDQNDSCSFSNCIMASGSKSSISSNTDTRSHSIAATPTSTPTPQEHTLQPDSTSTATSPSIRMSATDVSTTRQRRVRGPTLGKRTRSIIESKGGERLHVYVTEEMGALCGKYATKAANELGSQIRRMCPALGFHHTWKLVPPRLKSAILQAFRDKFKVTECDVENTPLVEKVLQKKASKIYAGWKNDMSTHYAQLKEAGKDPYQHPYQSISLEGWKFMIDNIFSDKKWQERSKIAKENRNTPVDGYTVRSRLHTMGSKSYSATITTKADKPNGKLLDFPERYKKAKTLKDGFWIDPLCEDLYDQMVAMQVEAELSGRPPPTDEEYSRSVLGRTDYYLRGPCVDPRPSSFSSKSSLSRQQLLEVQSNLESLREERRQEREEDERRHQEEREAAAARYEALQREQIRRDEEARMRNEALERQLSELRALVMGKVHGQDNGGLKC